MTGILTKKGINAQRRLFTGRADYSDEMGALNSAADPKFFLRAVVVDVVFDASSGKKIHEKLGDTVLNSELLDSAPRNSIVARVISGGADKRRSPASIFYPMFSHTHEPLKPGEHVWVFYEDSTGPTDQGFWVSRVCEPMDIDDPNFTHGDRKFIEQNQQTTLERLEEAKQLEGLSPETQALLRANSGKGPQFPNGGNTSESFSLAEIDAFEKIERDAIANHVITKEPVPRYSKRPADWAAEGSNNSLIVLGEDRTGAASTNDSRPSKDKAGAAGMFDVVVGRGIGKDRRLPSAGERPKLTSPSVIQNARKKLETDKEISKTNLSEGDPDFEFDATRLYGAMDTDVDGNFGKDLPKLNSGITPEKVSAGAALVGKSNHVRVIAREDGTIRIIKEGKENDESGAGRAVIMIEKDGTIMIDGPRIIVGSGIEKGNGSGTQVYLGRDAHEAIVLGNTMKDVLTTYSTEVQTSIDAFVQALTALSQALLSPPNSLGNFGLPLPGIAAVAATLGAAPIALKTQVAAATKKFHTDLTKTLSKNGRTK